jgi:hypothetical protein
MAKKRWYIKARYNPQLKDPYYVLYGQLTKKEAKEKEKTLYGNNIMLDFSSEQEYKDKISEIKADGYVIHEQQNRRSK